MLDEILKSPKPSRRAYCHAAVARIAENSDFERAIEYLDRYIRLTDPKSSSSLASAWSNKGQAYEKMNEAEQALPCYKESLNLDPGQDQANKALAKIKK